MSKLFNRDNSFFQVMDKAANFCILNLLALACCIPVVTVGATISACHKVMQTMLTDCEMSVTQSFFNAFRESFKKSTLLWLITLPVFLFLVADAALIYLNFRGALAVCMYAAVGIVCVVALGTAAFAFPMISRYDNTLKEHLGNALYLAFRYLPRTIAMVVLYLSPLLIALCSVVAFIKTLPLWIFLGISSIIFLQTILLLPVFRKLEQASDEAEASGTNEE